jgi:hypothetical protein
MKPGENVAAVVAVDEPALALDRRVDQAQEAEARAAA